MPESKSGALPLGDSPKLYIPLKILQRMTIKPFGQESPHRIRQRTQCAPGFDLVSKFREYAGSGARHERPPVLPKPSQIVPNGRIEAAGDGFEVVATGLDRKVRYFDGNRVSCQIRACENFCRGDADGWNQNQIPGRTKGNGNEFLAYSFGEGIFPENENGNVGTQLQRDLLQFFPAVIEFPKPVQDNQGGGRIRTSSAQPPSTVPPDSPVNLISTIFIVIVALRRSVEHPSKEMYCNR